MAISGSGMAVSVVVFISWKKISLPNTYPKWMIDNGIGSKSMLIMSFSLPIVIVTEIDLRNKLIFIHRPSRVGSAQPLKKCP